MKVIVSICKDGIKRKIVGEVEAFLLCAALHRPVVIGVMVAGIDSGLEENGHRFHERLINIAGVSVGSSTVLRIMHARI